jgi:hypothetical protein
MRQRQTKGRLYNQLRLNRVLLGIHATAKAQANSHTKD